MLTTSPASSTRVGVGVEDAVAAPHALDEDAQPREELAHGLPGETAAGLDAIRAQLDLAIGRQRARVHAGTPPPSCLSYSAQAAARSTPISFGPSCASRIAEPIVPKM